MNKITFAVETERILQILASEIYDSPFALLRENLQNAYDAILMRVAIDGTRLVDRSIYITIGGKSLVISDDGIGMSEETLRQNFWRAGSSGKRSEFAQRAGVIGTFGIGALANFGVCTKITVETRHMENSQTLSSTAIRSDLAIAEECISLDIINDERSCGTILYIELDTNFSLTVEESKDYLEQYVRFLPVAVFINGEKVSQQSYSEVISEKRLGYIALEQRKIESCNYTASIQTFYNSQGQVLVELKDIRFGDSEVQGELFLVQQGGQLFALRNFFGLAPVPIAGQYQFGGVANLLFLKPTAGREALSRESIEHLNRIVTMVETEVSQDIAGTEAADKNNGFLNHILQNNLIDLASNVTASVLPGEKPVAMAGILDYCRPYTPRYYTGRDQEIISSFVSDATPLLHVSQNNPRRPLQIRYITEKLKLELIPDTVSVLRIYKENELTMEEAAFLFRLANTLQEDYLLPDTRPIFAEISHGVPLKAQMDGQTLVIYLSRKWPSLLSVITCYKTAREVFAGFVKDFVRNQIYQKISQYVPSSAKHGADALYKLLQRNKELYKLEEQDRGEIESLLGDYLSGDIKFNEVLLKANKVARIQTQKVSKAQVGSVEQEIPDVAESPTQTQDNDGSVVSDTNEFPPQLPILRLEQFTEKKIIVTLQQYKNLNNFGTFLGLSDRLFKRDGDFFRHAHTTKIMWANHRVIYIFTAFPENLSMYYDIELKEPLEDKSTFGGMFPTTTIFLNNRIFVPIPRELETAFRVEDRPKEFFIRFDIL